MPTIITRQGFTEQLDKVARNTIARSLTQHVGDELDCWVVKRSKRGNYIALVKLWFTNGKWSTKTICESEQPFRCDCPLEYLDLAQDGIDLEWRKAVVAHHIFEARERLELCGKWIEHLDPDYVEQCQ
jgi:hypothetical protein